jgi:5'-nucleotidase
MEKNNEKIALFDLDQTLADYDSGLEFSMLKLQSPMEPPYSGIPRDNAPEYLKARADIIRKDTEWWANLPKFKLGFDIWDLAGKLGYRRMILTQGPKRNPNAWAGKVQWIHRNLSQDVEITVTRDKGLVYGKALVDDWPEYIERWLKWRPRGLVIMPANEANINFKHPQVIRYDGTNFVAVADAMKNLLKAEEE